MRARLLADAWPNHSPDQPAVVGWRPASQSTSGIGGYLALGRR